MEYRAYSMRLKKKYIKDYAKVHKQEKIWQSVVDGLRNAGFTKMIIFQRDQEVILFEEAENLDQTYSFLSSHKESAEWDKMIFEWMEQFPEWDNIRKCLDFQEVPVVFYFENGTMKH
jgi:L-rhamnose mutarotase